MPWYAVPLGVRGTQSVYSDAAIEARLTVKVLFGLPFRQMPGFVMSLLNLAGLDLVAPDYSTLCRRQKTLTMQLPPGARADRCICWPTAWDRGPKLTRMECMQAGRSEAPRVSQHPPSHRRKYARGPDRGGHPQQDRRRTYATGLAVVDPQR